MTEMYSARHRFLTFEEADILDRLLSAHLQELEHQGQSENQEANLIRQMLRDFVYFTSADTLEDLKSCLLASGWQGVLSQNKAYHLFWSEEEAFDPNGTYIALPPSIQSFDAQYLIIRAMHYLAFLEGAPETSSPYDILQQVRAARKEKGQKE
jgi:hypothetical protein